MKNLHEPIPGFKPLAYPQGDVTQFFGENPALYQGCCGYKGHNGWDIVRAHGTPIFCVQEGKAVDVRHDVDGNGKHVRILCENGEWIYGHLSRIDVQLEQQVAAGQQIGLMGNTGFVVSDPTPYWKYNPYAGTHLHLTFYPGRPWTNEPTWNVTYPSGDRAIRDQINNGYNGAANFQASDFVGKTSPNEQLASDRASILASDYRAKGDTKMAAVMDVIVQLLKAWGQ
jgi:murein DD-endopeptidase MepM/ murein hydrolase activator NlpD